MTSAAEIERRARIKAGELAKDPNRPKCDTNWIDRFLAREEEKSTEDKGRMIVNIYRFDVRKECEEEFARLNETAWPELFRHSPDYIATEVFNDIFGHNTYLTLDIWRSEEAFRAFQKEFAEDYQRLDDLTEACCESLMHLGICEF